MLDLDEISVFVLCPFQSVYHLQTGDDVIGDQTTFTSTPVFRLVHPPLFRFPASCFNSLVKAVGNGHKTMAFLCEQILCLRW